MQQSLSPYDRLDSYLEQLEAQEKSKRQRRLIGSIVLVIGLSVGGFFLYQSSQSSQQESIAEYTSLRRYAAEDLSPERVQALFVNDPTPIVIIHPVTGIDTISSMDDYYGFLNRLDLIDIESESFTSGEELEEPDDLKETISIPEFSVKVDGEKKVGEELTYVVENFDKDFELLLDFGNGITRKLRRAENTYTYPLPGHFDMHLKMVKGDSVKILQTIKYQIFPKEVAAGPQNPTGKLEESAGDQENPEETVITEG
jgi:hypothetical protein